MMNRAAADVQHRVEAAERARLEARHAITCADALAGTTAPELRATLLPAIRRASHWRMSRLSRLVAAATAVTCFSRQFMPRSVRTKFENRP